LHKRRGAFRSADQLQDS